MKKYGFLIGTCMIVMLTLSYTMSLVSAHDLVWAHQTDESMAFSISYRIDGENEGGRYLILARTNTIPSSIESWSDIPNVSVEGTWDSGGGYDYNLYGLTIYSFLSYVGGKFAIPIGDFDYLTSLAQNAVSGAEVINDATFWGLSINHTYSGKNVTITVMYAKSDGFLARHIVEVISDPNSDEHVLITREGFATNQPVLDFTYFGIIAVLIILIIILRMRR